MYCNLATFFLFAIQMFPMAPQLRKKTVFPQKFPITLKKFCWTNLWCAGECTVVGWRMYNQLTDVDKAKRVCRRQRLCRLTEEPLHSFRSIHRQIQLPTKRNSYFVNGGFVYSST